MRGMIYVDPGRCMGCHTCELACAVAHSESKELFEAIYEEPRSKPRVVVEAVGRTSVPLQCRHCEEAPCVAVCPTHAMIKLDEGPVVVRQELCTGCKACILVCPFGSIAVGPSGKVVYKCDLCIERLEMDEEPACVSACPTGALRFGLVDDMRAAERLIASEEATDVPLGKCRLCGTEFASEARLKGIQRRLQKAFGEGFSIDLCPSCRRKEFGRILVESRR